MKLKLPSIKNLKLPSKLTAILGAVAAVFVALNETTFDLGEPWKVALTIAVPIFAAWGISPLSGRAFQSILHLSNGIANGISIVLLGANALLLEAHMSATAHGIVAGVITLAAALGFAPWAAPKLATGPTEAKTSAESVVKVDPPQPLGERRPVRTSKK